MSVAVMSVVVGVIEVTDNAEFGPSGSESLASGSNQTDSFALNFTRSSLATGWLGPG
ncbi:MAG: hypothetical protein R2715_20600 [Ilumatobacteraceae bacterium]